MIHTAGAPARPGPVNAPHPPGSSGALSGALDRLARLAARFVGASLGTVHLVTDGEPILAGAHGLPAVAGSEPRALLAWCRCVVEQGDALVIPDARCSRLHTPEVGGWGGAPAAGVGLPVTGADGAVLAVLGVWDAEPRAWTAEQLDALGDLAASVRTEIEMQVGVRERAHAEAHYRRLVTTVPEAVYVLDVEGRFTELNPAAERILQRSSREVVGESFATVLTEAGFPTAWETFVHVVTGRADDVMLELTARRPSGEERLLSLTVTAIREAGRITGVYGIARDVTDERAAAVALRESEERLRQIAENVGEVFWIFTPDFSRTVYISPAYERTTGYPLESIYRDPRSFVAPVHPEDLPGLLAAMERIGREAITDGVEFRVTHADGSLRWFLARGYPVRDANGAVYRVVGTSEDITERKHLEEQFRQSQKMEAVGRLAGGVAHDFNNQLTAILGFANLLRSELPADPELESFVGEIVRAAERSARLTHQLLAFSRRQVLQPSVHDLNEVVRGMDLLLRRLMGKDLELVAVPSTVPTLAVADRAQLEQVLVNLVVNARDALTAGGRIVVQTLHRTVTRPMVRYPDTIPPGEYAVLAVSDDGHGLDRATLERVFEPFFTTKEQGQGTGLGLPMVLGTVKQSGGYVAVHSEPGAGSTFKIFLPRVDEPAAPESRAEVDRARAVRGTVLLVDDEPAVRSFVRSVLGRAGYRVLEAENGEEALRVWAGHRAEVEVVLTDLTMPLLGGRELGRRLRADRADLPVLYMSGFTDELVMGGDPSREGFLPKPFPPQELLRRIAGLLHPA
jgi:two-component system, cell cycle sensor histidine kinase and response regulator CckA